MYLGSTNKFKNEMLRILKLVHIIIPWRVFVQKLRITKSRLLEARIIDLIFKVPRNLSCVLTM